MQNIIIFGAGSSAKLIAQELLEQGNDCGLISGGGEIYSSL